MSSPLISILIPFKNTANFLNQCLDSIVKQTYQNWELIIVDDGSTDESYEIVADYTRIDKRIHLYSNTGKGIISALQTAYRHASGVLITRMDSDDIMATQKLEVMSDALIASGPGHIALGLVKYFSENGIGEGYRNYEIWLNTLSQKGSNFSELYKECVIPSPCWMVYRTDFERCGGFNSPIYPEDYDLAFRFYEQGLQCLPSLSVLHYWRDYPHRASRTDDNYAENSFLDLKLTYFLRLSRKKTATLVVWGAGAKGKRLAQLLDSKQIEFEWICDNPNKIGKYIYGHVLKPFGDLATLNNPQSIITVANKNAQQEIKSYLTDNKMQPMDDYFFFC